jgi:steroid delta-isomerase-like uncharacterized protein
VSKEQNPNTEEHMSAQRNRQIIEKHFDAVNARTSASIANEINTADATWRSVPAGASFRGPEGYQQFLSVWLTAFPDAKVEVKNIAAGDDFAVAQFTGKGTHKGPLKTPAGDVPPTGKPMAVEFCEVYSLKGGKIASCDLYFDVMGLMKQLGVA